MSEITGPASSGRTSVALGLLARTTRWRGEIGAVVDLADAFDPVSAESAGVDLERVLWARVGDWREALRSAERLLETEGIPVVLLDLANPSPAAARPMRSRRRAPRSVSSPPSSFPPSSFPPSSRPPSSFPPSSRPPSSRSRAAGATIPASAWIRLSRLAASTRTVLVVLSDRRLTGSQAEIVLEMRPPRPRFTGTPPLLEEIGLHAVLTRRRGGPGEEPLGDTGANAERLIGSG